MRYCPFCWAITKSKRCNHTKIGREVFGNMTRPVASIEELKIWNLKRDMAKDLKAMGYDYKFIKYYTGNMHRLYTSLKSRGIVDD